MAASQEKIAVYSLSGKSSHDQHLSLWSNSLLKTRRSSLGPDLKHTSDDAIPTYLNSISFTQSHFLTDVRLGLSYLAFAICAACFLWDYKLGFEDTKYYTAIAVAIYACVNGALSAWIWVGERSVVYVGNSKAGDRISIQSATKKHVPIYNLTITVTEAGQGGSSREIKLSRPFREWFDETGAFVPLPFQQMFASNVGIIGKADPKRVVAEKKKGAAAKLDTSKTIDEKLLNLLAESYVDVAAEDAGTSSATSAKGTKRRGKKA